MFPDGVKVWSPEEYQSFQRRCNITFMGLLILTSSGCKTLVMPPGMMANVVPRSFLSISLTFCDLWHLNASSTRRDFFFSSAPGRFPQTVLIQSTVSASFIQPLSRQRTTTPDGQVTPLGRVFLLKMMNGGSLPPSAVHHCESVLLVAGCVDDDRLRSFQCYGRGRWKIKSQGRLVCIPNLAELKIIGLALLYDESLELDKFIFIIFWQFLGDVSPTSDRQLFTSHEPIAPIC